VEVVVMARSNKIVIFRNSKNGRFVKEQYAKKHPSTTEREVIKQPNSK
jgi:hypothetical protein